MSDPALAHPAFNAPRLRLTVGRGPMAAPVLVRAISTFASRTRLPVERLSDLADILQAMAETLPGTRITLDARADRDGERLQLAVCDLPDGAARSLLTHQRLARLLTARSDGVAVRSATYGGESLVVSFGSSQ